MMVMIILTFMIMMVVITLMMMMIITIFSADGATGILLQHQQRLVTQLQPLEIFFDTILEDNVIFVILSKGWKKLWDFFSFPIFNDNKYNYNLLIISLLSEGKKKCWIHIEQIAFLKGLALICWLKNSADPIGELLTCFLCSHLYPACTIPLND